MKITEKLPPELKEKWVTALRSGVYGQGEHALCHNGKYCCLGVLGSIMGVPDFEMAGFVQKQVSKRIPNLPAPLNTEKGVTDAVDILTEMNDGEGDFQGDKKSFAEIADYIEQNF